MIITVVLRIQITLNLIWSYTQLNFSECHESSYINIKLFNKKIWVLTWNKYIYYQVLLFKE